MQAFAKDSANNVLGGSGPVNKDIDHAQYYGDRGAEAFSDFSRSGAGATTYEGYGERLSRPVVDRSQSFNPIARVDPVHGDESLGLGTSTFLEGAPASKKAIQRRESASESNSMGAGGLGRKKSLVQKIRGLNQNRQQHTGVVGRATSPDTKDEVSYTGPTTPGESYGRRTSSGGKNVNGGNPFFSEHDKAYDQKGESIAVAEREMMGHRRQPSSPKAALERRVTHDNIAAVARGEENKATGFLSRVKSLRGGRRQRPNDRAS